MRQVFSIAAVLALGHLSSVFALGSELDPATLELPSEDPQIRAALERVASRAPYQQLIQQGRLSVALVDLSDSEEIRYCGIEDEVMRYAASLPKIAVLLAAFDQVDRGRLTYSPSVKATLEQMIRRSSNQSATQMIRKVGFTSIAGTLQSSRYSLYNPVKGGGLWVGKDYGGGFGRWQRDPVNGISHGATARQVARFFVMLEREMLVSPPASREMKAILSRPALSHKFVKGLKARPGSIIYRKSGTWKNWHSDAALVERGGRKYVAVALLEDPSGHILEDLIVELDDIIFKDAGSSE